ncbi:MAG TPA: choice-of-anchor L domain-containing protein [Acidimicrobiia bacterium]|nr:choice-of-anchor L domain-containing protein [Acidimicrobiia bacterium]
MRVFLACTLVAGFAASGIAAGTSGAGATVVASGDATAIAAALSSPTAHVTGASFVAEPDGTPNGTSDAALADFPTDGSSFGILTTGDVNSVPNPGTFASTNAGGSDDVRGDTDNDVSILKVDVDVPSGSNCLAFDFKFLSEEYPRFVGTSYDDAFVAELDTSDWTTSGSAITAPNNFAFDGSGDVVSVNSTGIGGMTPANGAGTAFEGNGENPDGAATGVLHAFHQVSPGAHSLYFSIFDQGDHGVDSAVFLDNLRVGFVANPGVNCAQGATPVTYSLDLQPPTASNIVGAQHSVTATLTDQDGNPIVDAPVDFTVTGANPGTDTEATDDSGAATLTYTGTNAGSDQISACYDADDEAPCEAVASASADWAVPGLDVQSGLTPNPVTEGDNVVDDITVTATGATNHNVVADVTSDLGGNVISANPSQGFCDDESEGTLHPADETDNDVVCYLGDLTSGASATIQVVVNVPSSGSESGTFNVSTNATSDEVPAPGVTSEASTNVASSSSDSVSGYVPPGGSIDLGPGKPSDNTPTVASFALPGSGAGAQMTLDTETAPTGFCGGSACRGDLLGLTDFSGYTNPKSPAVLQIRFDRSIATHGANVKLYVQKSPEGPITPIAYCGPRPHWTHAQIHYSRVLQRNGLGPHSGYAVPSPCINAKKLTNHWLQVQILLLSGDPKIGFR